MKLSQLLSSLPFYITDNVFQESSYDPDIYQIRYWSPTGSDPYTLYLTDHDTDFSSASWGTNHILFINEPVPAGCSFGISISADTTLAYIRDYLQEVIDQSASASNTFHDLYRIAKESPSIDKFVQSVHEILGNDLLVVSASFSIIASVVKNKDFTDTFVTQNNGEKLSKDAISFIHEIGGLERLSDNRKPFLVEKGFFPYSAIITSIRIRQRVVGYLCVLETDHTFSHTDYAICESIVDLIPQLLYSTNSKPMDVDAGSTTLLENLLAGNRENIVSYASIWGWDRIISMRSFLLITCTINPAENKAAITNLHYQLKNLFPDSAIVQLAHCFVILLFGKNRVFVSEEKKKSLESLVRLHKEKCVIGFDYGDIFQTQDFFHFSQAAFGLVVINHNENNALYEMEGLYFQILINNGIDVSQKKRLIHPDILFLERYDSENGSDLTNTLKQYLYHNRNITTMAKEMHISRSTGFYRINLIRDLLDDSISDPQKMFCYECSFELIKQIQ